MPSKARRSKKNQNARACRAYKDRPARHGFLVHSLLAVFVLTLAMGAVAPASVFAAASNRSLQSFIGAFTEGPNALAVDQSNGDVYAIGHASGELSVLRYTPGGAPDNFTTGPNAGTNTLTSSFESLSTVAIDNTGGAFNGDIYVAENAHGGQDGKVEVFGNDGASVGTIVGSEIPGGHFGNSVCGVAIDQSDGTVYVSEVSGGTGGEVWRFTPSSPSGSIGDSDYTVTGIAAPRPCGLAADSGNVYVQQEEASSAVVRYAAASFNTDFSSRPASATIDVGTSRIGATAVQVDHKTGEIYVDEGNRVAVFDSSGAFLYRFGLSAYLGARSKGIALKSASSGPAASVYASDHRPEGRVVVFGAVAKTQTVSFPDIAAFGSSGNSGSSFGPHGPNQLAFDQAARRLYAVDPDVPGIDGFDASSPPIYPPLSGFAPLITAETGEQTYPAAPDLAVDNTASGSAGNLYLASGATNLLYGWNSTGTSLGGAFPADPASSPGPPNGLPKSLCGDAVDSAGNVWVANSSTERILEYSPSGASLPGVIDTSAQGNPCHLAFDSKDDLYVNIENIGANAGVWKYSAAGGYASATKISKGNGTANHGNGTQAIAVDPSTDHLYLGESEGENAISRGWVDEYDPAGNLLNEFGTSLEQVAGITVDATNHDIYVADRGTHKIRVFGPGVILPEATVAPATTATNTTANLNGEVDTQGIALSDCHFEYVSEAAFRSTGFNDLSSGGSVPCSPDPGSIPLDLEGHEVSAIATGLVRDTVYHLRLFAANASGATRADGTFSSASPPLVETTGSPVRTATTARLEGRVDPSRAAATYHFEYGNEGPCSANPCEVTEAHAVGSENTFQLVSQAVEGLEPDTTYYYRVVADNGDTDGPAAGGDMTLTTRASDQPLSHGHFPGPPGSDRAWEQVSIPDSGGNPVNFAYAVSDNGERVFYRVSGGTPISSTGTTYSPLYAERTSSGWRSENIYPPRDQLVASNWLEPTGRPDLSDQIVMNFNITSGAQTIWRLRPGQPASKVFEPEVSGFYGPVLASEDASRVLLYGEGTLDPAHPVLGGVLNLYDVTSGTAHLVDLLPDGSIPACGVQVPAGAAGGPGNVARGGHLLTADGSLAFFQGCDGLYLRDLDAGQTKLISHQGIFIKSTPGAVFFTTTESIDPDDNGGSDVYRYDIGNEALKCVTCVVSQRNADVIQTAVAANGSRVYFTSSAALLPGVIAPAIYRVDVASGSIAYVGPSDQAESIGEDPNAGDAISPDGSTLIFASNEAGLNAVGGQQNGGTRQYYRYDDRDRSLICLSCPQDGQAPLAEVDSSLVGSTAGAGANKTALSADGETFAFGTPTALVGADQNTARSGQVPTAGTDIYEWRDGRLLLISDGLTNWPVSSQPAVSAVTPSGHDVFFAEAAQLTPDALDGYRRLYDARINGEIEFPPPPKPCPLEVCQGTPKGAPEEAPPGTGSFAGPGNQHQAAQKKKKKHHKRQRQHKKQSRHQAKQNRRAPR